MPRNATALATPPALPWRDRERGVWSEEPSRVQIKRTPQPSATPRPAVYVSIYRIILGSHAHGMRDESHGDSCDGAERRVPTPISVGQCVGGRESLARASSSRMVVTRDENNLNVHWISILRARTHSRFVSLCPESNLQRTVCPGAPTCRRHITFHDTHRTC